MEISKSIKSVLSTVSDSCQTTEEGNDRSSENCQSDLLNDSPSASSRSKTISRETTDVLSSEHSVCKDSSLSAVVKSEFDEFVLPTDILVDSDYGMAGEDAPQTHVQLSYPKMRDFTIKLTRCPATDSDIAQALNDSSKELGLTHSPWRNRFSCPDCSLNFNGAFEMLAHAKKVHNKTILLKNLMKTIDPCFYCQRVFLHNSTLARHSLTCGPNKNKKSVIRKGSATKSNACDSTHASGTRVSETAQSSPKKPDTRIKVFACLKCSREFGLKSSVYQHIKKKHGIQGSQLLVKVKYKRCLNKPFCRFCSYTAEKWSSVYEHERVKHSSDKSAGQKQEMSQDVRRNIVFAHQCSICQKKFVTSSQLMHHSNVMHKEETNQTKPAIQLPKSAHAVFCHLCGVTMIRSSASKHLKKIHKTTWQEVRLEPGNIKFVAVEFRKCMHCGKSFKGNKSLHAHLSADHNALRKWPNSSLSKCSHCSLVFLNKVQLEHHLRSVHKPHNPPETSASSESQKDSNVDLVYPCSMCGQVLSTLNSLEKHMRNIHYVKGTDAVTIEGIPRGLAKPPSPECKICGILFETWSKLYSHLRKESCNRNKNGSPTVFCCSGCDMTFQNRASFENHKDKCSMQKLTSIKSLPKEDPHRDGLLVCMLCDNSFFTEADLSKHLRRIHRLKESKCSSMLEQARIQQSSALALNNVDQAETAVKYVVESKEKTINENMLTASQHLNHPTLQDSSDSGNDTQRAEKAKVFTCELCDMSYHSHSSLARHYRENHRSKITSEPKSNVAAPEKLCPICKFSTNNSSHLEKHCLKIHGQSLLEAKRDHNDTLQLLKQSKFDQDQLGDTARPVVKVEDICISASNLAATYNSELSDDSTESDSSSSDSSSDDSDTTMRVPVTRRLQRYLSTSSSSSSSSDDCNAAIEQANKCMSNDVRNLPAKVLTSAMSPSRNDANLLAEEILQLDSDIFSVTEKPNVALSDADYQQPIQSTESNSKRHDSTTSTFGDTRQNITESCDDHLSGKTKLVKLELQSNLSGNVLQCLPKSQSSPLPSLDCVPKVPPVAVLKPFSSIPENSFQSSLNNLDSNMLSLTKMVSGFVTSTVDGNTKDRYLETLPEASALFKHTTHTSFPIYSVNSVEYILPCVCSGICIYRRICYQTENRRQTWSSLPWYDDFDMCQWKKVALLPEPLHSHGQVTRVMNWLLAKNIVELLDQSCFKALPRINKLFWIDHPDVTLDKASQPLENYAICGSCGFLSRDSNERYSHLAQRHPLALTVNQDATMTSTSAFQQKNKFGQFYSLSGSHQTLTTTSTSLSSIEFNHLSSPGTANTAPQSSEKMVSVLKRTKQKTGTVVHSDRITESVIETHADKRSWDISSDVTDQPLPKNQRLDHHNTLKNLSHPFVCSFCNIEFLLKCQMEHHMSTLHQQCTLCTKMFKDRQARSDHIANDHGQFICLACEQTELTEDAIKEHIVTDHVDKETGLFNCTKCQDKQLHPESIIEHLKEDDMKLNRMCHLCNVLLPTDKSDQLAHFCSHSLSTVEICCTICNSVYLEPWALRLHFLNSDHPACAFCLVAKYESHNSCSSYVTRETNPAVVAKAKQLIRVPNLHPICSRCCVVIKDTSLKKHCDEQHRECNFQCELCGQRFEFQHQKSFHMSVHKKKAWKTFVCSKCLRVTASSEGNGGKGLVLIEACSGCTHYSESKPFSREYGSNSIVSKGVDVSEEVAVLVEHVETNEVESGDVRVMLDGKLYSFSHDATTSVPEDEDEKKATSDSDSDVLFIAESKPNSELSFNAPSPKVYTATKFKLDCPDCSYKCNFQAALNKHMQMKHGH